MFTGPPIFEGSGRAEAQFFLDGNHSRVSLMARIVPSPDWFVGIDSFELCMESSWLDSITIEVDPMDAGTDNGFTFTAPNWATEPQGVIYRITSHYPPHPAGSFYYPYLKRLPPIATFQFIKLREYELSEVFHHGEDDKRYDLMRADQKSIIVNNNNQNNDVQIEMEVQRREQEIRMLQQQQLLTTRFPIAATSPTGNGLMTLQQQQQQQQSRSVVPGIIPKGSKDAILNSIVETYHNQEPLKQKNKNKKGLRKYKAARECRVGDWGAWSMCSVSCGVGEMTRHRTVERHPRRGGKSCPPLTQTKWCGAANDNCPQNLLNSNW
ncbi:M-spondin [Lycorma delicatula]|uniref:M-spondin n=1 Tax=Lycorma delicatula TaxID=130591 RepID=UPI003F51266E